MRIDRLPHTAWRTLNNYCHNRPINSVTEIKITRLCNQGCKQCNIHQKKTEPAYMTLKDYQYVLHQLHDYGCMVAMISGGEPFLHPDLSSILTYTKKVFPFSTSLVSGLYFPTAYIAPTISQCLDSGINIQTSLDSLSQSADFLRGVKNHAHTVLKNMEYIANEKAKRHSSSFLYANCVLSAVNLDEVPDIINKCKEVGWKTTIGVYHTLTETTRENDTMIIRDHEKLKKTIAFLSHNPDILNLDTFIQGIPRILTDDFPKECPFVKGKRTSTRLTIWENGDIHLCGGGAIGNILTQSLTDIFSSDCYHDRLQEYTNCPGCWSSCYTQKHLLFHPRNLKELLHNATKLLNLKTAAK